MFIMPPSVRTLKERLTGRGTDNSEQIERRVNAALREIPRASEFDYIVVNDDLEKAAEQLCGIIRAAESSSYKKNHIINEVLENA